MYLRKLQEDCACFMPELLNLFTSADITCWVRPCWAEGRLPTPQQLKQFTFGRDPESSQEDCEEAIPKWNQDATEGVWLKLVSDRMERDLWTWWSQPQYLPNTQKIYWTLTIEITPISPSTEQTFLHISCDDLRTNSVWPPSGTITILPRPLLVFFFSFGLLSAKA